MAGRISKFATSLGRRDQSQDEAQQQSLTTILSSHEDRTSLLLLIADCTDLMKRQVLNTFDPNSNDRNEQKSLAPLDQQHSASKEVLQQGAVSQSEHASTSQEDEEEARLKAEQKAKAEYERRVKELNSEPMHALKQSALNYFDGWRDKVVQRVGEALNDQSSPPQESSADQSKKTDALDSKSTEIAINSKEVNDLQKLYPPTETSLRHLSEAKKVLILHSLLLLVLSLEIYPAESRVLLLHLTSSLGLPLKVLTDDENKVAKGLLDAAEHHMNADEETKKQADANSTSRKWKVGLGAAAGAVLIGVTGGLAAPLLAAGIGTVMGGIGLGATATAGYLGALAGSAPLVGALFGAYGGRMTGKMVDSYAKEVEDFAFIPVKRKSLIASDKSSRRLRVAIGISGWLTEEADVFQPWQAIGDSTEAFALRWELKALMGLGNSLTTYIKSAAWSFARREILMRTIFATLTAALTLPYGMAKAAKVVDNPFSVAKTRSDKAGKVLADALINKVQGERPVTLIGYSLGARVIYVCLDELANRNAFGLVESVVLAGAATPSDSVAWRRIRSVVTGRVVNVYSSNDYLLSFLYRTSSLQYGVAGLQAIEGVNGIENVDASEIVNGHLQYRFVIGKVLEKIHLEDIDVSEVEKQIKQLRRRENEDEEERKKREAEGKSAEEEGEEMEKEVAEKNKASQAMDWVSEKFSGIAMMGSEKPKELTPQTKQAQEPTPAQESALESTQQRTSIRMIDEP